MKTERDLRLDCVKLATAMATAKVIPAKEVIDQAKKLLAWVNEDGGSARDLHGGR